MASSPPKRRRRSVFDEQLSLPLSWLSDADFLAALHRRRLPEITKVRFRENRSGMISVSADRTTVNLHACFRAAPGDVLDAVASFIRAPHGSTGYRRAVERMRAWWDGQAPDPATDGNGHPPPCCATPEQREFLRAAYERLNARFFSGRLPPVPIRLSTRMSQRFGHVHYARTRAGARVVEEIALTVDLMLRGNERHLLDTLLHEMAHVEAWIFHAHQGHGPAWRRIAARVGCEAAAGSRVRIRRRARQTPVTHVPELPLSRLPGR